MRPMPDLATAAIADLHAWHEQQNLLVRALTEPLTARVTDTLTAMQAVIDAEVAAREALQAEQAIALQVTKDRIDQLERMMFGQRAERTKKTPDARKEARQRRRSELSDDVHGWVPFEGGFLGLATDVSVLFGQRDLDVDGREHGEDVGLERGDEQLQHREGDAERERANAEQAEEVALGQHGDFIGHHRLRGADTWLRLPLAGNARARSGSHS